MLSFLIKFLVQIYVLCWICNFSIKSNYSEHHFLNYYSQYSLEASDFFLNIVFALSFIFSSVFLSSQNFHDFQWENISFEVIYSYLSIVSSPSHDLDLLITERNSEHGRNRNSMQSVKTWMLFLMVCLNKTEAFNWELNTASLNWGNDSIIINS